MKIESLLRVFDDLADDPERISEVRKLILASLLSDSVSDLDATSQAEALRQAHNARRQEFAERVGRKSERKLSAVLDEDLPPNLVGIPTTLFERLGNVAFIEKGLSQIQRTKPGKYPLVVTAERRGSSESWNFEGPAAIVPMVSSTGHGDASLKRLHYQEGKYAVGNILSVVQPICPKLVHARFLFEYLSAFKEELLVSRMVGTANVSLTVNKLKEVPVPLVSGVRLNRIAELMALCDRLEAQQQERETRHAALARASLARFAEAPTSANLEFLFHNAYAIPPADLRKSILTLAVQGKLVRQDPNDEPAADLLARIDSVRRSTKAKHYTQVEDSETPYEVPSTWLWVRLGNVALTSDSGWSPQCESVSREGTNWGVLKVSAVSWGVFKPEENKALPLGVEGRPGCEVYPGDFLLSRANTEELVARSVVVEQTPARLMMSDKIVRFRFPDLVDKTFINLANSSEEARSYYAQNASGTSSSMKNIGRDVMCNLPIPLPPLAEQRRIVAKVHELMALVDKLEAELASARTTATNLLAAAVAELTQGKPSHAAVPN